MSDFTAKVAYPSDTGISPEAIKAQHLLEASAGTGKTYSIQTLYLRLILVEGLTVQQILVVTFTRDATKELRERLQTILREALDYLKNPATITDPEDRTRTIVDAVAPADGDKATARQRLRLALLDFDMAAVFTIHGFCQRVLNRFAFETGQAFDVEPTGDSDDEIEQLCKDWWRKNVYNMDEAIAGFLSEDGSFTLEAITKLAGKLIAKPDAILDGAALGCEDKKFDACIQNILKCLADVVTDNARFADMPEDISATVESIENELANFREHVRNGKWMDAIAVLQTILEQKIACNNPCKKAGDDFTSACKEFKDVTSRASEGDFCFDAEKRLTNPNKRRLAPHHSERVYTAAQTLLSQVEQYRERLPTVSICRSKTTKAFLVAETIQQHVQNAGNSNIEPSDLANAIRRDAGGSLGLKADVIITIDAISPLFRQHFQALTSQPVLQAALAVEKSYQQNRPAAATASFNDFLVDLRSALEKSDNLRNVLREQFCAALIDEFQDTDPIQWGIFEKLFKDAGVPCFLVGDPKQAIYRFRNGDIETYLQATQGLPDHGRHRLNRNFRSEKRLIDAVNQIFLDPDNDHPTFGTGIAYPDPLEAEGKITDQCLLNNGKPDKTPFKILLIENSSKNSTLPGKNSPSAKTAYALTAREIARILGDAEQTIGDRRIAPRDIAVLVKRHEEAGHIADQLRTLGIPSVRQGTGDVWQTDEGRTLWVMLEAVLDARNLSHVRNALFSLWCGLSIEQIWALNDNKQIPLPGHDGEKAYGLDDWVARFEELRETWMKRGFPAMLRQLMAVFVLKKRLLAHEDRQGQRRLANIGHLSELVERKIIEDRVTPEGLLSWIRRQFDRDTADGGDETKLRLETDDDAVRIMTIFTSKGLEFPIVFAPTLFMMKPLQRSGLYEYHDEEGRLHIARKNGDDNAVKEPKDAELGEMNREHVRQIYVALTRAVHRTVVLALKDRKSKINEKPEYRITGGLGDVLRLPMKRIEEEIGGVPSWRVMVDMDQVAERFDKIQGVDCAVEVSDCDPVGGQAGLASQEAVSIIDTAPARPAIDTSMGHGSFSSLAPREGEKERADAPTASSEEDARNRDGETATPGWLEPAAKPEGIFAFPAGARTGTCWHEIFEELPFDAPNDDIRKAVEQKLGIHGFLKKEATRDDRIAVTTDMVKNVLKVTLPNPDNMNGFEPFALDSISLKDRKTEWAFSFATLQGKRTGALRKAISTCETYAPFTNALGAWDKEIPGGYLTGFVDLLFRKDHRYYIADWKSNRRNGTQADFQHAGLREEISLHRYWLQYLVYTVAVHQYLSRALPGYRYATHFGGAYYLFLRGVDGKMTDDHVNGVYADRPPEALVNRLSAILGDFS